MTISVILATVGINIATGIFVHYICSVLDS